MSIGAINKQKQVKQKTHVSGKITYLPPTFVVPNAQNIVTMHKKIYFLLFVCAGPLVQREALARIMLPLLQGITNLNQAHRDSP